MLQYLKSMIGKMAQELRKGEIPALPLRGKNYDACSWCPYFSVCGHEKDDPSRKMTDLTRDDAIRAMNSEGKGEDE